MIDIYDSHHDRRGETSARKLGLTLAARIPDTSCWLAGKLCQTPAGYEGIIYYN